MPKDRFMIAPLQGGLTTNQKPWQITDDSFAKLQNAYMFRGRVRKRFGSRLMNGQVPQNVAQLYSRLRMTIGTTDGVTGDFTGNLPGDMSQLAIGQAFSVGNVMFTVYQLGANVATLSDATGPDAGISATINSTTNPNSISITGNGTTNLGVPVYYYPALPVMGLIEYETAQSTSDPTYAFDTQFAYQYDPSASGGWDILGPLPPAMNSGIWTGADWQFFWGTTWQGSDASIRFLFITNNNEPDLMQYYSQASNTWTVLNPQINAAGDTLQTALMLVVFKDRLIALNTTENISTINTVYTNRARWSAIGDPSNSSSTSWRQDIPGQGSALDAPTLEDIVSCEFIKDRLIVFFERSTWELVYNGNQAVPFQWQKLNTELGAESTWSVVPFDKIALVVGNTGIHVCNGVNVERVDDKIPDQVWNIHTGNQEVTRVYGVRDYYAEQVYWTFPNPDADPHSQTFPNQLLVYNYKLGSWAINDDSITVFGPYYQVDPSVINWNNTDITWDNNEINWDSGTLLSSNQEVLAGNQEGFTFIIDADISQNSPSLQITNITAPSNVVTLVVIDHNFNVQDYIYIQFLNGLTGPFLPIYEIVSIIDSDTFTIIAPDILARLVAPVSEVYTGGGTISRVSRIDILTKQFNFYVEEDRNAMVERIDFLVDRTDSGEITIDYATSTSSPEADGLIEAGQLTGTLLGNSVLSTSPYALYPLEFKQDRLWHPVYLWADGEAIQLRIYFSDQEMLDYNVVTAPFQLHAMTFFAAKSSSRLQ
jgi:hypothetical protein